MIGLDTNVIIRHLTDDDPSQSPRAHAIFAGLSAEDPGFITVTALLETYWVLRSAYHHSVSAIIDTLSDLVAAADTVVESADDVSAALATAREPGVDFADAMIAASGVRHKCRLTWTFDTKAARLGGMQLVPGS